MNLLKQSLICNIVCGIMALTTSCLLIASASKIKNMSNENAELKDEILGLKLELEISEDKYIELWEEYCDLQSKYNDVSYELSRMPYETLSYIRPFKEVDRLTYYTTFKSILSKYNLRTAMNLERDFEKEEIMWMLRTIETEVYQQSFDAKVNVANVILNRIQSDNWSDDAVKVCCSPYQFANYRTEISEDTILALEYAYIFEDTTDGAIAFRSDMMVDGWNGWECVKYDGCHWFYAEKRD